MLRGGRAGEKQGLRGGSCVAGAGLALLLLGASAQARETSFLANHGQWPARSLLRAEQAGTRTWFERGGWLLELGARRREDLGRGCALRFAFVGGEQSVPRGVRPLAGVHHFLLGDDPARWRRDVPCFERVVYDEVWPGIDLVLRDGTGAFEYDLRLAPGARLEDAVFELRGALGLALEGDALVVSTPLGELRQSPPLAWSVGRDGAREALECSFVLLGEGRYGFAARDVPADAAWVVDPGLEWSTYVGGFDEDIVQDVVLAANGDVVVCGTTLSQEYPVTLGAYDVFANGARDAFVTRLAADGQTLVWSTLLGGSGDDRGVSLAVADAGKVWVCGDSESSDFPSVPGGYDLTPNGGSDVFVARLGPSGATLLGSTLYGAAGADHASALVLTPSFEPVLVGWSDSAGLPTSATAFDTSPNGARDAFVAGFSADLSGLSFASFLGGSGNDMGRALALGPGGELYVAGLASSANFPTTAGSFDPTHNPGSSQQDGFVARLDATASQLGFATFFGGGGRDVVEGLALDPTGDLWLVGTTESADLPLTSGALGGSYLGLEDGFAARLTADGATLVHSSYLAGTDRDRAYDVAVDGAGNVAICGETRSDDFPRTVWSFDDSFNSPVAGGVSDAYVLRLDAGGGLDYGAFLGGMDEDFGLALALDALGGAVLVGATNSYNFPTTLGAYDRDYDLSYIHDGFVTRFDFAHFPYNFGTAKINSQNSWAVLGYSGFPSLAAGSFDVYLDGGIPFSYGFLFWSAQPGGGPFMGGELLMGPPYTRTGQLALDWFGAAVVNLVVDPVMVGSTVYYQAWYADSADPWGVGLSNGLSVTYYP